MHALGHVIRRVAAVITTIAVCGLFGVRAERAGHVGEAQFSAAKTTTDYAAILPEEFAKVSRADSWTKPNSAAPVCANFVVPELCVHVRDDVLAIVTREELIEAPRLTGVVELRI